VIVPARYGANACWSTCTITGCIRNHVIISPRPISTWFDGAVCVPSAWRRKWKTTSNRTIGVIDSNSAGSRVSSVSPITIDQGTLCPPFNWLAIVSSPRFPATGAGAVAGATIATEGFFAPATGPCFAAAAIPVRAGFTVA
jgi:hypothetical protein